MSGASNDLDLRGVAIGAISIFVMIVLSCIAAWFAWQAWKPDGAGDGPDRPGNLETAGPRLEPAPRLDREAYFAEKNRELHAWQWVDRKAGIARIPIEDAMDILVRQHQSAPPEDKR